MKKVKTFQQLSEEHDVDNKLQDGRYPYMSGFRKLADWSCKLLVIYSLENEQVFVIIDKSNSTLPHKIMMMPWK